MKHNVLNLWLGEQSISERGQWPYLEVSYKAIDIEVDKRIGLISELNDQLYQRAVLSVHSDVDLLQLEIRMAIDAAMLLESLIESS